MGSPLHPLAAPTRPRGLAPPPLPSALKPIYVYAGVEEVATCLARTGFVVSLRGPLDLTARVSVGRGQRALQVDLFVSMKPRERGPDLFGLGSVLELMVVAECVFSGPQTAASNPDTRPFELVARRLLSASLDRGFLLSPPLPTTPPTPGRSCTPTSSQVTLERSAPRHVPMH